MHSDLCVDPPSVKIVKALIAEMLTSTDVVPARGVAILSTFLGGLNEAKGGGVDQVT